MGIAYFFGMPGAHILPVYDSLYDSKVKSVLLSMNKAQHLWPEAMQRIGKNPACITTAGLRATNLVTGIANAYADIQPILIITVKHPPTSKRSISMLS